MTLENNTRIRPFGTFLTSARLLATSLSISLLLSGVIQLAGCISDEVDDTDVLASYQRALAHAGPRAREDTEGIHSEISLGLLKPAGSLPATTPDIEVITDPNTGKKTVAVTIEQAIERTLANSPEITVVSFNPSIAQQDVTQAAAEFDVTAFGQVNQEQEDNPVNSIFQPGQSDSRLVESGIKQKTVTGSEWSLSYGLSRNWDDLAGRSLSTRYEPVLGFQLKQPLLRDGWQGANLAGLDIARLRHRIALLGFRQKAEDVSAEVISSYWKLFQAHRDFEIQRELLNRTQETLSKVVGRSTIDATGVQIKQVEASVKSREAMLLEAGKTAVDAQDDLVRLVSDQQLSILSDFEILTVTEPSVELPALDTTQMLQQAIALNPMIQNAKAEIAIADVNIRAAENGVMPRLDLIASGRTQSLDKSAGSANDRLGTGDYVSYAVGLSLEYPFGNRSREAELLKRRIERRQVISKLQSIADQLAIRVRERARRVKTSYAEIQVQADAVAASKVHLQALEDSEPVRERLTPEFLLVKLQAQEDLAIAQRSEIRAVADFNISLIELAHATGTVLKLHQISPFLESISNNIDFSD